MNTDKVWIVVVLVIGIVLLANLAMFAVVFLQIALLVVFGQLAVSVDYMNASLGPLLVSVSLSLWVAAWAC